jgi:hypothetical protein
MAEMIRIEGMEQVRAALARFDDAVQNRAMMGGLHDAGMVMKEAVEAAAPIKALPGGRLPDGALKSDVRLRVTRVEGAAMAIVDFGKLTYFVARWVEYGHRLIRRHPQGNIKLKVKGGGMGTQIGNVEQHPFIRPAFEASVTRSVEAFVNRLKAELKKRS